MMNNKKLLFLAIFLVLAKSALGIEVEPNNDSSKANTLGISNSGKLNRASDVDFFKIDSCVKDSAKKCTDKRREEVSLSFTCNNRSALTTPNTGWFLGIHDANGELQETYQVKPEDCVINSTNTIPFNFRFSSLESSNYYISVISDCAEPNYIIDPEDFNKISVNSPLISQCGDKSYNGGTYTIKDNPDNELKRLEYITSSAQKNLGLEQSGQISSLDDIDIYVVDSDGTTDVPLLFTCGELTFRQTNDWKVSIFNDANGLVNTQLINGSSCGSVFIGDKGGQSMKLPKGSQRYYLAVESACVSSTQKSCVVDTSEYSILRDVDKVYSGKLATKKIDEKSADLKLKNCGLSNNAVISIKAENVDLASTSKLTKLPINIQIGNMACRILAPEFSTTNTIIGTIADSSKITDSTTKAKDSANIILNDCSNDANAKITLTGSKLDLVNLTPNEAGVIPIKVNVGDFRCEAREVFTITTTNTGTTYSNVNDSTAVTTVPETTIIIDSVTALATAKNIGASQTNQLKSVNEVQAYYVDTVLKSDVNIEFSCPNSVRFTNDWMLSIYNKDKQLISTQLIDGSSCGTGQAGDSGTFKFAALKDSTRSYFVVKSACETGDSVCVVDSSQYQIKRIIPTSTTSNTTNTATNSASTSTCFYSSCTTSATDSVPVFGAK